MAEANTTNWDESAVPEWSAHDVTFLFLYCLVSAVGTTANLVVITALVSQTGRSRNSLMLCLCASDLLVCTVSIPVSVCGALVAAWTAGNILCKTAFYLQSLPVAASTMSLMMLSLDRYATVKHARLLTRFKPPYMMVTVWTGAACITGPILYAREVTLYQQCKEEWPSDHLKTAYTFSHLVVVYLIPCLTVAACHFSVGHKLCATAHSTLPLPMPLMRKPQRVIVVASVLPDKPSKVVPYRGNIDEEDSSDEAVQLDMRLNRKTVLMPGRQSSTKARTAHSIAQANRRLRRGDRLMPPLVKQISRQSLHSRRRLANMLIAMVIVFATCWAPYVALRICAELSACAELPVTALPFCLLLGHTHSAINPLVYYLCNRQALHASGCGIHWPWDKSDAIPSRFSAFRRPPPSSTNEAALGVFHPSYTTKRYQPRRGCTNDYL